MTGTLHDYLCTFVTIAQLFVLSIRNISDKFAEKIKTHIFSITFLWKFFHLWDNVATYGAAGQATGDNIIQQYKRQNDKRILPGHWKTTKNEAKTYREPNNHTNGTLEHQSVPTQILHQGWSKVSMRGGRPDNRSHNLEVCHPRCVTNTGKVCTLLYWSSNTTSLFCVDLVTE
jgi:hypothetical protein